MGEAVEVFDLDDAAAAELLQDDERLMHIKRFVNCAIQVCQGAPEQLFQRTIMTYLICEG
jgi:hypothetical protein